SAAQTQHNFLIADLLANAHASLFDEGTHRPIHRAVADVIDKILQNFFPARRVRDFGVKLQGIKFSLRIFDGGKCRIFRARGGSEAGGQGSYFVTVTAPDIDLSPDS